MRGRAWCFWLASMAMGACRRAPSSGESIHAEGARDATIETDADAHEVDDDSAAQGDDGPLEETLTAETMDGPFVDHADVCKRAAADCRVRLEADHVDAGDEDARVSSADCACAPKSRRAVKFPGVRAVEIVQLEIDSPNHAWRLAVQTGAGWWLARDVVFGQADVGAGNAAVDVLDAITFSVEPIDATGRRYLVGRLRIAQRYARSLGVDVAAPGRIARRTDALVLCGVDPAGTPSSVTVVDEWLPDDAPFALRLLGDGTVGIAPGIWGPMGDPVVDVRFP